MDKKNIARSALATYVYFWIILTSHISYGKPVFEDDWDLLIVLDACRVDALKQVQSEYEFIKDIDVVKSRGSTSKEWVDNNFTEKFTEEIEKTAYISANAFSYHVEGDEKVDPLESPVFEDSILNKYSLFSVPIKNSAISGKLSYFESARGVVRDRNIRNDLEREIFPPDILTNQAIKAGRENEFSRMMVHYMQPHAPYIYNISERQFRRHEKKPWNYLRDGGDVEQVWKAYINNLRLVLDNVERLLKNYGAEKVVITADHGELFGEWKLYNHIYGIPHPKLRNVPWVETTASDSGAHEINDVSDGYENVKKDIAIEDRLQALGYR